MAGSSGDVAWTAPALRTPRASPTRGRARASTASRRSAGPRRSSAARLASTASSVRRVAATSCGGTPRTAIALTSSASGTSLRSSARPCAVRKTCTLAPVARDRPAHDVAASLHRLQRGEGRGLHHAGLAAQLALRQAVGLPQHAQERPVADRHLVLGEAHLQRAIERAHRVLDEVRQAIVGTARATAAAGAACRSAFPARRAPALRFAARDREPRDAGHDGSRPDRAARCRGPRAPTAASRGRPRAWPSPSARRGAAAGRATTAS